jgi:hypothetical protein
VRDLVLRARRQATGKKLDCMLFCIQSRYATIRPEVRQKAAQWVFLKVGPISRSSRRRLRRRRPPRRRRPVPTPCSSCAKCSAPSRTSTSSRCCAGSPRASAGSRCARGTVSARRPCSRGDCLVCLHALPAEDGLHRADVDAALRRARRRNESVVQEAAACHRGDLFEIQVEQIKLKRRLKSRSSPSARRRPRAGSDGRCAQRQRPADRRRSVG